MQASAVISGVLLAVNALAYVLTVLAARLLAPAAFGELSALLALLLIGTVPAAGLQAAAALRPGAGGRMHAAALATSAALVTGLAAGAVPLTAALQLTDGAALGWLALLLAAHTVVGAYQGLLQGAERHRRLATASGVFGALKVLGGIAGLLAGRTPAAAVAGLALGAGAGAAATWWLAGRPAVARGARRELPAIARAAAGLLGFVVLTNLDVLLARYHLPADAAGRYALGAVITKVAFWLPQGVGVVLLPRLGGDRERAVLLPRALALVGAVGLILTGGAAVGGPVVETLLGGADVGRICWLFALLGTLLALGQLLLLAAIAAADRSVAAAVWAAAALEVLAVTALAAAGLLSVPVLALTATAVTALLVGGGVVHITRTGVNGEERQNRCTRTHQSRRSVGHDPSD